MVRQEKPGPKPGSFRHFWAVPTALNRMICRGAQDSFFLLPGGVSRSRATGSVSSRRTHKVVIQHWIPLKSQRKIEQYFYNQCHSFIQQAAPRQKRENRIERGHPHAEEPCSQSCQAFPDTEPTASVLSLFFYIIPGMSGQKQARFSR